jgi:hypothetical protein
MIGTSAAFVTTQIANVVSGSGPSTKLAYSAAIVALAVYAVGFVASFALPEPSGETLPD